jgi:hypothetical protein
MGKALIAWLLIASLGVLSPGIASAAEDPPPEMPDISLFTPGKQTSFRMPFFAGLFTFGGGAPLFNVIYLPADYKPEKSYPLCIQHHPRGGNPDTSLFCKISKRQAIVIGTSWPLTVPNVEGKSNDVDYGESIQARGRRAFYPALLAWAISRFNIDRSRIFVGGFSLGGHTTNDDCIQPLFRDFATHFVVCGAGNRYRENTPELYKGRNLFYGMGAKDNVRGARVTAAAYEKAGMIVTFVEEPGMGHGMGDLQWSKLEEWYASFDPAVNAEAWMKEAAEAEAKTPAKACEMYAKLQVLGSANDTGRAARAKLEALEGPALSAYDKAFALLRTHDYPEARKAFQVAGQQAKKSPRLSEACAQGLRMTLSWQFLDHLMAFEEATHTGRDFEAALLAQDGLTRYASDPVLVGYFKDANGKAPAPRPPADVKRKTAQVKLVDARMQIWNGKAAKAVKELDEVVVSVPGTPEALDAKRLLAEVAALIANQPAAKK